MIPPYWIDELSEEVLTAKLARVVRIIMAQGTRPTVGNPTIIAPYAAVLQQISHEEGKAVRDDTFRQRLKDINVAVAKAESRFNFILRSHKPDIRLEPANGLIRLMHREVSADAIARSTEQDTSSAPEHPQEPRAIQPYKVFVSHAWDVDTAIEDVLDEFVEKLKFKLSHLTPKQQSEFQAIELWFDRGAMTAGNDFQAQTDRQCAQSQIGVFVLSDKWHQSEPCKIERRHFCDVEGTPETERVLCLQLTGKVAEADDGLCNWPNFPTNWRKEWNTLIRLWSDGTTADKDEFVEHVRDEICNMLRRQGAPSPEISPSAKKKVSPKLNFNPTALEEHVRLEKTEDINAFEGRRITGNSIPLLPKLLEWACNDEAKNRVYAILGSFGAGKTTAVQLLAKALSERRKTDDSTPFPVYLDFRRLQGRGDAVFSADANLGTIITHCMDPFSTEMLDVDTVIEYLRKDRCVLIFDGLDEIGTLVGIERATNLYRQLLQIVEGKIRSADARENAAQWSLCPLRILITCRTHFFRDHIAEKAALNDYDRSGTLSGRKDNAVFKTLYMAPFAPDQIENFFVRTLGEKQGAAAIQTIRRIHDLEGLASKPVMTRYIVDLVPEIEADHEAGRTINTATVYGHLFRRALERDSGKAQRLSISDREDLLEAFALFLWQSQSEQTSCKTLESWFDSYVENVPGLRLSYQAIDGRSGLHTELRNTSFLIRETDENFRFSHTSFYEYFLARGLTNALIQQTLDQFENTPEVSRETLDFLVDLAEFKNDFGPLQAGVDHVLVHDMSTNRRQFALSVAGRCVHHGTYAWLPKYSNLSSLDLLNWRLESETFRTLQNVQFTGANCSGVQFRRLHFVKCDFDRTNLAQSSFDRCTFEACSGDPFGLASTRVRLPEGTPKLPFKDQPILGYNFEESPGSKKGISATIAKGHTGLVNSVSFSPDGLTVLSGSYDNTVRLWDVSSGTTLTTFKGHEGGVTSVSFSPDGLTVLSGSYDGTVRLWDVSSGTPLKTFKGHEGGVTSVSFSPDGLTVLSGSGDGTVRLWDVSSGTTLTTFKGHEGGVTSVSFSPDGLTVLSGSGGGTVCLWDVSSGTMVKTFKGHKDAIRSVSFSPDGLTVLSGSGDGTVRLWDVSSGTTVKTFKGHKDAVRSVSFSPNGLTVLSGSYDGTVRLWDVSSGTPLKTFKGHDNWVSSVSFSPDGLTVLSGSYDHTVRLWDVSSGTPVQTFKGYEGGVSSVSFSPDGLTVLSGSIDHTVRLWDVSSGTPLTTFKGHKDAVRSVSFSPDGLTVLSGSYDHTVRLWDISSGTTVKTFKGDEGTVTNVSFSPDGLTVLSGSSDGTVRLWDVSSGTLLKTFKGDEGAVTSVSFSPDGLTVLSGSSDGTVRLWDVSSGTMVKTFKGHKNTVSSISFAPDGLTVLSGSYDNTVRLWDVSSGTMVKTFKGDKGTVTNVSFSPDGHTVLSGSYDNKVRLWDVSSGTLLKTFKGHEHAVTSVSFSPDGLTILSGSYDGTARLWDVSSGLLRQGMWAANDGWILFDANETVIRMSENGWKYITGVAHDETGFPYTVCPDLPEIVFDKTAEAAN